MKRSENIFSAKKTIAKYEKTENVIVDNQTARFMFAIEKLVDNAYVEGYKDGIRDAGKGVDKQRVIANTSDYRTH